MSNMRNREVLDSGFKERVDNYLPDLVQGNYLILFY